MSGCSAVGALGIQASRRETTRQTNERRSPRDTTHPYQQSEKNDRSLPQYNITILLKTHGRPKSHKAIRGSPHLGSGYPKAFATGNVLSKLSLVLCQPITLIMDYKLY